MNDLIKPLSAYTMNYTASIRGAGGGGGGQRAPIEAPDSLRSIAYARILDLVSEGEIVGFADQEHPLRCVYLNETPVENDDGSLNFKNIQIDSRVGTQTQDYIKGFGGVENDVGANVELRADTPFTRTFANTNLSAIRVRLSLPALSKTDTSSGDTTGYSVTYAFDIATDGGAYQQVFTGSFTGKASNKYERTHRIDLPPATTGWQLRVRRLTADSDVAFLQDTTVVESVTEIVDAKFRMPMSALVGIVIDAEQFNNIPSRAYDLIGRIIRVPSNYDPDTGVYTGVWDGTFQSLYSNNPAWCFYDLVLHSRYGLGHLVDSPMVNKWVLYRIGQYCDGLVDDGFGGVERRFTLNAYLETREDAARVLMSMVSVFRGMMYAAGGEIVTVGDMPIDPVYTYTPANVINGDFIYSGSSKKVRSTVALVSWSDPSDFGRQKIEYVQDDDGIARYGIQQTEIIAFGCTSRGQARRAGKYILTTERYETDVVSFSVGLDGTLVAPGAVVYISDPLRAGRRTGGRSRATTINSVTVDSVPIGEVGNSMVAILPNGTAQVRPISAIAGNVCTVSPAYDDVPVAGGMWAIESNELALQRFRVLSVVESNSELAPGYDINAVQHVQGKFSFVEEGLIIDEPDVVTNPISAVPSPQNIEVTQRTVADMFTTNVIVNCTWDKVPTAVSYTFMWRQGEGNWLDMGVITAENVDIIGIQPGVFEVQVCAVNAIGIKSVPAFGGPFTIDPNLQPPGYVVDIIADNAAVVAGLAAEEAARMLADAEEIAARAAADAAIGLDLANGLLDAEAALDAAVETLEEAIVTGDSAEASSRTLLAAQLRGTYPGTDLALVTSGLIYSERVARVAADSAIASDITALDVRLDSAETGITGVSGALSALDARVVIEEGKSTSQASNIVDLRAGLNTATSNPNLFVNPTLEVDTASWATGGTGGAFTRQPPDSNGAYGVVTATGAGNNRYVDNYTDAAAGVTYAASVDLHRDGAVGNWRVLTYYVNSSDAVLAGPYVSTNFTSPLGAWQRVGVSMPVAPAGTAKVLTRLYAEGTTANAYWRRAKLERATLPTPYNTDGYVGGNARALSSLSATVSTQGGLITAQAADIVSINSSLAGKASVSAVTALTTRVTEVENDGYGVNLLSNASLALDINGWTSQTSSSPAWTTPVMNLAGASWHPPGINAIGTDNVSAGLATGNYINIQTPYVPITPGEQFIASAYISAHRCVGQIYIEWTDAAKANPVYSTGGLYNAGAGSNGGTALSNWARVYVPKVAAPAGKAFARVLVQFQGNGNGTPYGWIIRPMLERARATQTLPSQWNPGGFETFSSWSVMLDSNGYVSGIALGNTGTTSSLAVRADLFSLVSPSGGARLEYSSGNMRVYDASNVLRVRLGVW